MECILTILANLVLFCVGYFLGCLWYRQEKIDYFLFMQEELGEIKHLQEDCPEGDYFINNHTAQFGGGMPIDDYVRILKTSRNTREFHRKLKKYINTQRMNAK